MWGAIQHSGEAVLCGRKVSGACCERHTGCQHIISLSTEPLLTVLAFTEPREPTDGFLIRAFKPDLVRVFFTLLLAFIPLF